MTRRATLYFQAILVVLVGMNQFADLFPAHFSKFIPFLLVVVGGWQALFVHGYTPDGEKLLKREPYIAPRDLPDEPEEKRIL